MHRLMVTARWSVNTAFYDVMQTPRLNQFKIKLKLQEVDPTILTQFDIMNYKKTYT